MTLRDETSVSVKPLLYIDPEEKDFERSLSLNARHIPDEQVRKFESYAAEILTAFGLDLNTPGTKDTPQRFIRELYDATSGYDGDPKLLRVFPTECTEAPPAIRARLLKARSIFSRYASITPFRSTGTPMWAISPTSRS